MRKAHSFYSSGNGSPQYCRNPAAFLSSRWQIISLFCLPPGLVILATCASSSRTALPLQAPKRYRPSSTTVGLQPVSTRCLSCGRTAWVAYHTQRRITTLHGRFCLSLTARRCSQESCHRCHHPYRREEEGRWALPHGEYSLDVAVIPRLPAPVILKEKRHFELCWRMKEHLGWPLRL